MSGRSVDVRLDVDNVRQLGRAIFEDAAAAGGPAGASENATALTPGEAPEETATSLPPAAQSETTESTLY
jgi:hypothetical protein